jgi:hypothetical protein
VLNNPLVRFFSSLLLFAALGLAADTFPTLETENLLNQKVVLPDAARGKPAVLVIGFTHASQTQTKSWTDSLGMEFPAYSIAVLEDAPRLVRPMAIAGMKSGVAQDQRARHLVLTHQEKELKSSAGFAAKGEAHPDDAWILLLDRDGAISWRFHGPFTQAAHDELKARLGSLE